VGKILLICRLAARDLQMRRAEAALMLVVITAATATLTMGLALSGVTSNPYLHTMAVTNGPDVVAGSSQPPAGTSPQAGPPAALTALEHAPGVTGYSGPYPVVSPTLGANGHIVPGAGFSIEGRDQAPASIDQPKVTQGTWVRPGGVVIEPTYAAELGVRTGDQITLNGRPFRVAGLAVTAAWPSVNAPGLMWLTTADARSLATAADPLSYQLNLKLADPASATAFANIHSSGPGPGGLFLSSWQQTSSHDAREVQFEQVALVMGSWLLSMLALASVAVLVGGRMAEQTRRVGLLKAVGGTPKLVAAVLLAEHLAVALAAAAAGLAVGWLAAPLLTSPADGLIGAAGAPSFTPVMVGVVAAVALVVAILATFVPAVRAARTSTVAALADAARMPRRRAGMVALSRRLPVPLLLGLRLAARRPRRAVLNAASITIVVAMLVAVLAIEHRGHAASRVPGGLINPVDTAVNRVVLVVMVVLVILAAVNSVFVAWATVLDSRHPVAVTRSLGATSEQVRAGLAAAQLCSAFPGAILGIPAGIGLDVAVNHTLPVPSAWRLLAVVVGTMAAVAALTTVAARIGDRHPVGEILQAETA
jgi:putative ABC transport system permease protein